MHGHVIRVGEDEPESPSWRTASCEWPASPAGDMTLDQAPLLREGSLYRREPLWGRMGTWNDPESKSQGAVSLLSRRLWLHSSQSPASCSRSTSRATIGRRQVHDPPWLTGRPNIPVPNTSADTMVAPSTTWSPGHGGDPSGVSPHLAPTTVSPSRGRSRPLSTVPVQAGSTSVPVTSPDGCHGSHDRACGPLRWSRAPGPNTPAKVGWDLVPSQPIAGQPFDIVAYWSDAEASYPVSESWCMPGTPSTSGGGPGTVSGLCSDGAFQAPCGAYGVWDPPAAHGGSGEVRFTRTLPAGSYNFDWSVVLSSIDPAKSSSCQPDPYPDHAFVSGQFTVAAQ